MTKSSNDDNDGVGYGRPPKQHRFKKGKSGNPSGRPKGMRTLNPLLSDFLFESILITEGGKQRRITRLGAAVIGQLSHAAAGKAANANALARILQLSGYREYDEQKELTQSAPKTEVHVHFTGALNLRPGQVLETDDKGSTIDRATGKIIKRSKSRN